MKQIILIFAAFFSVFFAKAQSPEQFRIDYDLVAIFKDGEWGEWQKAHNTLVFNANENSDVIHYTATREKTVYRKISSIQEGYAEGNHYQWIRVLDDNGTELFLQLFDDPTVGAKLIYHENLMALLAKSSD